MAKPASKAKDKGGGAEGSSKKPRKRRTSLTKYVDGEKVTTIMKSKPKPPPSPTPHADATDGGASEGGDPAWSPDGPVAAASAVKPDTGSADSSASGRSSSTAYGLPHRSQEEYDAMSFDSIKAEAEQHGLSSDGIRAVVIARLIGLEEAAMDRELAVTQHQIALALSEGMPVGSAPSCRPRRRRRPSMSDVVAFDKAHVDMGLSEGNAVVTKTEYDGYGYRTAASGAVLKGGGRHMVQLTVRQGTGMLGLIRADRDAEGGANDQYVEGHSFYRTSDGKAHIGARSRSGWEGMQSAKKNDRIGLLLDLDAGSLTVYKNDERLGVMQKSGPGFGLADAAGYRWAVALYGEGDSARIDAVPVAEPARLIAQHAALQDTALPAGTRLRVEGLGDGVYERWERKTFGANAHFLDFGGGAQQVALRSLAPSQWSVLPPLAAPVVTVRALEVTGGEAVEVEGVSLDWSVSQLNAAIVERRGRSAQLQRLVLGDVALDDEDAQLSSCGVVDGMEVHAPRIVCVLMNLPTFFFVVLDATRSCARLCPSHTHANDDAPAHCVSHEAACPAA
jgi:hypothetical protein